MTFVSIFPSAHSSSHKTKIYRDKSKHAFFFFLFLFNHNPIFRDYSRRKTQSNPPEDPILHPLSCLLLLRSFLLSSKIAFHGMVTRNSQKSDLGMTKSMNFFQNIIKPFKRSSNRGNNSHSFFFGQNEIRVFLNRLTSSKGIEDDIEKIAALEQKVFPFQVLVSATKDFNPTHKLGEGGFGPVFKVRSQIKASFSLFLCVLLC